MELLGGKTWDRRRIRTLITLLRAVASSGDQGLNSFHVLELLHLPNTKYSKLTSAYAQNACKKRGTYNPRMCQGL